MRRTSFSVILLCILKCGFVLAICTVSKHEGGETKSFAIIRFDFRLSRWWIGETSKRGTSKFLSSSPMQFLFEEKIEKQKSLDIDKLLNVYFVTQDQPIVCNALTLLCKRFWNKRRTYPLYWSLTQISDTSQNELLSNTPNICCSWTSTIVTYTTFTLMRSTA